MLGAAEPFPPVFIQWHSPFIHAYGLESTVSMVEDWLDKAVMEARAPLSVSRIDLYCDFQGWTPKVGDLNHFSCRAVRRNLFEVPQQAHLVGRRFSGFTFGKGDVVSRIYDKTLLMPSRGEHWQEELWTGRNPLFPVWRVEFQLRRRALRRLGLETLEQALASRQSLWDYATAWLSLREPGADGNMSRWKEAPSWRFIRAARPGSPSSPLVRVRRRDASLERLVRGFVGYASSLGAVSPDQDLDQVLRWAGAVSARYLRETGRDFADLVESKRSRTGAERLFGVSPNGRTQGGQLMEKLLLDVREAASVLGCGRTYVYGMIQRGELPVVKLGRLTRIPAYALGDVVSRGLAGTQVGSGAEFDPRRNGPVWRRP
jgi:excisionase family DNA binding protein